MKRIVILGSTGSIGESTLQVARHLPEEIKVVGLAARSSIDLLEKQAREFHPEIIAVYDQDKAIELQKRLPHITVLGGMQGLEAVAAFAQADFVVSAMTGTLGLIPTVTAIKAGKDIGLANKEALISGGSLVMSLVREKGVNLIPIDSEHSAIFQCLKGEKSSNVHRIVLTASGGPFRNFTDEQLEHVDASQALAHPTWRMGPKITVDCSTLMNKGLEMIEAHWLFNVPPDKIEIIIHPQSIIHSLVEFVDNSMLAQMSIPNMLVPIQYALTYPKRLSGCWQYFDFTKHATLQFLAPDVEKFRCLALASAALKEGKSLSCYMNAANEILVNRFLEKKISWKEIGVKLEKLMLQHKAININSLDDVIAVDGLARQEAAIY